MGNIRVRDRIHNILLEALISESPLFTAVAIKVNGKVYKGNDWDTHSTLTGRRLGEDWYDKHAEHNDFWEETCGFIDVNGDFVTRRNARAMVNLSNYDDKPNSDTMRQKKELMDFGDQDADAFFDGFEKIENDE